LGKSNNSICIVIGSKDLFGTERRYLKIIDALDVKFPQVRVHLVVNSTLFKKIKERRQYDSLVGKKIVDGSITVLPDSISSLGQILNVASFLKLFVASAPFHLLLRGRGLALPRWLIGRRSSVEVTSVDVAKAIAGRMSIPVIKATRFLCVSETVEKVFISSLDLRRPGLAAKVDIQAALLPYHQAPPRNFHRKERLIVSACRFIPRKNVVLFSKALRLALPNMPGWKVSILGQGPEEEVLRNTLADEIASGRVEIEYAANVSSYLERAALFVSLIEPDNYPSQSVLEAMDMNAALLLSDTGVSHRFIDDNRCNGKLVPLDTEEISRALVDLCSDADRLEEYGKNSRLVSEERFSESAFLANMLDYHGISVASR
jgi:glycosyltransferase involved in cell wall biosynthesis